jgi:hypothetical protein
LFLAFAFDADETILTMITISKTAAAGDRLCGLVIRVPGYRSKGPGSIPGATRFSEIRHADHVVPSIPQQLTLTSPTGGDRSVGIVRSGIEATEFSF